MKRLWPRWVELWDRREDAAAIALVRILVGLVLVYDFAEIWRLDLVTTIYTPDGFGIAYDGWLSPQATWWLAALASLARRAVEIAGALARRQHAHPRHADAPGRALGGAHALGGSVAARRVERWCVDHAGVARGAFDVRAPASDCESTEPDEHDHPTYVVHDPG